MIHRKACGIITLRQEVRAIKVETKKLAVSAMLITLDVMFTRVLAINTPLMKIGFGFAAVAVSAMFFGPLWAMLTAALGDIVGALVFPVGAFFPGFTLTAALTGLFYGLCLYNHPGSSQRAVAAALLNCFFVTLLANTALIAYISGNNYGVLFTARAVQFFIMFPIEAIVIAFLNRSKLMETMLDKYKNRSPV